MDRISGSCFGVQESQFPFHKSQFVPLGPDHSCTIALYFVHVHIISHMCSLVQREWQCTVSFLTAGGQSIETLDIMSTLHALSPLCYVTCFALCKHGTVRYQADTINCTGECLTFLCVLRKEKMAVAWLTPVCGFNPENPKDSNLEENSLDHWVLCNKLITEIFLSKSRKILTKFSTAGYIDWLILADN